MLDFRITTFLKLCETKSYTNTAKILKMTQPSVTQHIKYLQKRYNCQLFKYEGKTLSLTPEGEYLRRMAQNMSQQSTKVLQDIRRMSERHDPLRLGCTKDLGGNIVSRVVGKMLDRDEELEVTMIVENSTMLIDMLESGQVDFALVDSVFDNGKFGKAVVATERYSGWANPRHCEELKNVTFRKMFREKLLVREEGASNRVILEDILDKRKCELDDFYAQVVCNAQDSLTTLTAENAGITFAFDVTMEDAMVSGRVARLHLTDFNEERELVFLYLKENINLERCKSFFKEFKQLWLEDAAARKGK
jgi:DNA-binding transcriptional LysR family regulator